MSETRGGSRGRVDARFADRAVPGDVPLVAAFTGLSHRLRQVAALVIREGSAQPVYESLLEAAVDLMRADLGCLQIVRVRDDGTRVLALAAHRGFDAEAISLWSEVQVGGGTSCSVAFGRGDRVVIPDVERCDLLAGALDVAQYLRRGIHALQSTPLRSHDGDIVGMISTLWRRRHEPSGTELALFDVLAGQAADLLERRRASDELREANARLQGTQERLMAALDASPVNVFTQDLELRYTSIHNPAPSFGVEGVLGKTDHELLERREDAERLTEIKRAVLATRQMARVRVPLHFSGQRYWYDMTVRPQYADGRLVGILATAIDSTDDERAAEALRLTEERARIATSAAQLGVHDYDVHSGRIQWDARVRELWGVGPDTQVTYDVFLGGVHPEDRAPTQAAVERARDPAGDGTYRAEYRVTSRADGQTRWIAATGTTVFEQGRAVRLIGTVQDVTERKRSAELLRRNHETFYRLVKNSPFGLYIVDSDFRLVEASAGSQNVFSSVRPLLGRDFAEVLRIIWPEPFARDVIALFRHTLDTGEPYHAPNTTEQRRDIDTVESYDWKIERITLPDGTYGVVCHFYDATRLREGEQALRDADRRKNEFLAVLSHELRNPLAPLANSLMILEGTPPGSAQAVRALRIARRQVGQMARLVDDLLDVNRIASGKIRLDRETIDLGALVTRVVEDHQPICDERGLTLTADIGPGQPWVDGDSARLAQALGNLLQNALKFTEAGGAVRVRVAVEGDAAVVSVRDTGIGIEPAAIAEVFQPFYQTPGGRARSAGLGLGLALVKGIVDLHGGRIAAESGGPGAGATFTMHLPAVPAPRRQAASPAPVRSAVRKVLIIEDNDDSAASLQILLELGGHEVATAPDGRTGLARCAEFEPDVVLCDIGLPDMSGYDVARALRGDPRCATLLVALTGFGLEEDRRAASDAGFDAHLTKPANLDALHQLLFRCPDRERG